MIYKFLRSYPSGNLFWELIVIDKISISILLVLYINI